MLLRLKKRLSAISKTRISVFMLCLTVSFFSQAAPSVIDRIVAVVDDDIIMESELIRRVATVKLRMNESRDKLPDAEVMKEQVLERMVVESIELQTADRAGIRVDDNQINETLANIARQNNMTTDQFRETILDEGLSWAELRDQIQRELIINQLRQRRVVSRIQITDQDISSFLASETAKTNLAPDYRLGHILIPISSNGNVAAAEEKAMMVYNKLLNGEDFAALAVQYSSSETALSGGDLGWRKAAQIPTLFADTVLDMKKGDIAQPIQNSSGFHLIKITDVRGATEQVVQQTKTRHILVKPNEIRSEVETRELIDDIHHQLTQDPTKFPVLAKTYSDDPGSALQGGDLGWVMPGSMVPEFEEVMKNSKKGVISSPFRSKFGWHVLQVESRRNQDMSEEFRRNRARQILQRRKYDEELEGWLRESRQNAYVEIKL